MSYAAGPQSEARPVRLGTVQPPVGFAQRNFCCGATASYVKNLRSGLAIFVSMTLWSACGSQRADEGGPSQSSGNGAAVSQSSGSGAGGQSSGGSTQGSGSSATSSGAGSSATGSSASSGGGSVDAGEPVGAAATGAVTVDPGTVHQTIEGFGGSDAFAPTTKLTSAQAQLLFDPNSGIGLSMLRIGIDVNGSATNPNGYVMGGAGVYSDIKLAAALVPEGLNLWGTPWSPPAADKSNDSLDNGGTLDTGDYTAWSAYLASVPAVIKAQTGVQLYAISAQNEPDFTATYASCLFSAAQMVAFVKVLAPMLSALTPPVSLIAAEPDAWSNTWGGSDYGTAILADPVASAAVNIIATHDYDHESSDTPTRPSPPAGMTQRFWETEMSDLSASNDVDMVDTSGGGLRTAIWIYAALTTGGATAWHHWWLVSNSGAQGLLVASVTTPPKRYYTVGNFSKFVRPGYVRIDVGAGAPTGVYVIAFENQSNATTVIVAINTNTTSTPLPVFVAGSSWPTSVTPYVTDENNNLAAGTPIALTSGNFSASLTAQSVTTFVGAP